MWPVTRPVALAAGETRTLTERLPLNFFGERTVKVILPLLARPRSLLPDSAVSVSDTFWPLLSVTDRKTMRSPDGRRAPFLMPAMATGALVPVKVRSLDTTGALAAVAMPLVARVATAAVAVMTRNVCMCHTNRTMLEPQASGDVAAMRVALRSCYPASKSTRRRGDRDPVVNRLRAWVQSGALAV